jgi:hypothetical protein
MRLAYYSPFLTTSILCLALACGGDDDGDDGSDADAGSEDVDAGDDGGDDGDDGDGDDGGDDGGDAGPDGGMAMRCGGLGGLMCEDTHYCDWADDTCGAVDTLGECLPRPSECEPGEDPVCACNGMPYGSPCEAAKAGFDVSEDASCAAR